MIIKLDGQWYCIPVMEDEIKEICIKNNFEYKEE